MFHFTSFEPIQIKRNERVITNKAFQRGTNVCSVNKVYARDTKYQEDISARRWSRVEKPAACWESSATRSTISWLADTEG